MPAVSKLIPIVVAIAMSGCNALAKKTGIAVPGGEAPAPPPAAAATQAEPPAPPPAAAPPAAARGTAAVAQAETTDGLPPKLLALLDSLYADPSNAHVKANVHKLLNASAARFAPAWDAFVARKAIVDAALARSAELVKAGDLAAAREVLEQVITPVRRDASGHVKREGGLLEAFDAELPAVQAVIQVAAKQRDYVRVAEAAADLSIRRAVGSERTDELSIWLASDKPSIVSKLWSLPKEATRSYTRDLLAAAYEAKYGGARMAIEHTSSVGELGLEAANIDTAGKRDLGGYMLLRFYGLEHTKITGRELRWKKVVTWKEPYACVVTNRIASIHPRTGAVRYQEKCKFRNKRREVSLQGTLAADLPAWTSSAPASTIHLIGVVEKAGPAWVLDQVRVPDLRFLERVGFEPYHPPY